MTKRNINPVDITHEILKRVTSGWFDSTDIDHFVDAFGVAPGKEKVDFVQRFLAVLKSIPQSVMDQETRDKVLEVGQEYIDKAIEEENKLEDEEEN